MRLRAAWWLAAGLLLWGGVAAVWRLAPRSEPVPEPASPSPSLERPASVPAPVLPAPVSPFEPYGFVPDFPLAQVFHYPIGIAAGPDGRLYVADKHYHRIQVFSPDGRFLREWGGRAKGTEPGEFDRPSALAVAPDGVVYVADVNNHRLQAFDADGRFLRMWGGEDCDTFPRPPGKFCLLEGVGVGRDGTVYVADSWNHRLQAFTPAGRFLRRWGKNGGDGGAGSGDGEFRKPMHGVAVAPTGPGGEEEVYVADRENHRIQVFDTNGRYLRQWGGMDCEPPAADGRFCNPAGIVVAPTGPGGAFEVVVADAGNHRIQVFTPAGAFIRKWGRNGGDGSSGKDAGAFDEIHGVTVTGGRLFAADAQNNRIQRFTPDGTFVAAWGAGRGDGPGQFYNNRGVALDRAGNLYVADTGNGRIQVFDPSGRFLRQWGAPDCWSRPRPGGRFCEPEGIFVDRAGRVYVADTLNHRVQVFDPQGRFIAQFGKSGGDGTSGAGPGEFNRPSDVAVDAAGTVYVSDTGNHRIQAFIHQAGRGYVFVRQWGRAGAGPGEFNAPYGVGAGPDNRIYVADEGNHRIQVFRVSPRGVRFLGQIGGPGKAPGRFDHPHGVRLDAAGNIYVVDGDNRRVQKLDPTGARVLALWGGVSDIPRPGRFALDTGPAGLAVSPVGDRVLVADPGFHRVQAFRKGQPDVVPPEVNYQVNCDWGWGNRCASAATIALTATDAGSSLSAVAGVRYRIDGGGWRPYDGPIVVGGDGVHTVRFDAVDAAGNRASDRLVTVRIDRSAPGAAGKTTR